MTTRPGPPAAARCAAATLLLLTLLSGRASAGITIPTVPDCPTIPVALLGKIDSSNAKTGDVFRFRTIESVTTLDGHKISRGSTGYGLIAYAASAGAHGKVGRLLLEARYVSGGEDGRVPVTIDEAATAVLHSGSTKTAPSLLGAVPIPFFGVALGAFNYLQAGKNVVLESGFRFAVTPVGDLGSLKSTCARAPLDGGVRTR